MASLSTRLELTFWSILPSVITLLLILVYIMPKHIGGLSSVMPILHMIPIFYWGMASPREMPYWFVFIAGILMDVAMGLPLGITALLYIMFLVLMRVQLRFVHKEGFVVKWLYFGALLLVMLGLQWLLAVSQAFTAHELLPLFMQWLLTVCCYPAFSRLFDALRHRATSRRLHIHYTT